jgi:D-3-phosphoglycerate dehydrogenase
MPKILIIQLFHERGMALLEARDDIEFEIIDGKSEAELADKIRDADAATIRTVPLPAAVIDQAERLKVVSRHGVGYDNVDVAALTRRGIPLAIAADANATAVAEHTLFFMLALAKQALRHDRAVRKSSWEIRNRFETVDLMGRHVLVLGYGRIGREVAKRCAAFDMQVSVYDPLCPSQRHRGGRLPLGARFCRGPARDRCSHGAHAARRGEPASDRRARARSTARACPGDQLHARRHP